jgi:hypothetical protein
MDVEAGWITGPALELMLQTTGARDNLSPLPGVFQAGDEVLVTDYGHGSAFVGVLIAVALDENKPLRLRIARQERMASMQWGWWGHVIGWRRPHG